MLDIREYILKMDTKVKLFVAFIIFITASYLLYTFSITPLINQRKQLKMSFISKKKLLEVRQNSVTNTEVLETELKKKQKELEDIEKKFLTEEELPFFFTELRTLAVKNKVEILKLKIEEKQATELPVNISLSSPPLAAVMFLAELREKQVFFNIPTISMSARKEAEGETSIETDLRLILYTP